MSKIKETVSMLTTVDNPYDPFEEFDLWFIYDIQKGYNSCALLDRMLHVSEDWNEDSLNQTVDETIDEIIQFDPFEIYKKVQKEIELDEDSVTDVS